MKYMIYKYVWKLFSIFIPQNQKSFSFFIFFFGLFILPEVNKSVMKDLELDFPLHPKQLFATNSIQDENNVFFNAKSV